ncbi:hypothetical protein KRP22_008558 [Phytophthora ramorum]|uniref:uncharacterized protein n=1 Tax=Phytophthora ramorum TaxID=164328 RepID=UPI0030B1467C|nr:hypothetical protein KRP23_2743 [Phytophthora ramorum]KAH7501917.1 hypothetical protein KRP22_7391 [Phytophthora ramorum]
MIPPVKTEPAVIAPTPSTAHQEAAAAAVSLQRDNQLNAALEITQHPPETWYKDQFGRKATFQLRIQRTHTFCEKCVEQRLLKVQLLYESGKEVEKQEILHVMSGQCLNNARESILAVRIAEVSKNHLNQRFRVEIAVSRCPGACDYDPSVVSDPVLVLSKKKKRPVKETDSPATAKKVKRTSVHGTPKRKLSSESPDSSQSSSTITSNVTAAIAEMEDSIPPRMPGAMAPFAPDTPNLCLWANAAFDLLYKLQWQRVPTSTAGQPGANLDEILAHAMSKAYKCPSCQETYGQIPTHRGDCDLKLLLEQGGQTESASTEAPNGFAGHHSLHWSSDQQFDWTDRAKTMYSGGDITPKLQASPYNLSQDLLQLGGHGVANGQAPTSGLAPAVSVANLSINTWKEYASISKLLYSTSYLDAKSPQAGGAMSPTLQWTGTLPPFGTLSPGFPILPSATKNTAMQQTEVQHNMPSQRFSALLAATKGMPIDAADLFRESDPALHGDGNIVNSLSNLSVSDLIRSRNGDILGNDARFGHKPISLSALLSGDQPVLDMSSENKVQVIMASDFRSCGFPALDASLNPLGFYHLLTETRETPAELRFGPNIFPLPAEMLEELESTISQWEQSSSICYRRESSESDLDGLKRLVLRQVAPQSDHAK